MVGPGERGGLQILADQLTLSQPEGWGQIMPPHYYVLAPRFSDMPSSLESTIICSNITLYLLGREHALGTSITGPSQVGGGAGGALAPPSFWPNS